MICNIYLKTNQKHIKCFVDKYPDKNIIARLTGKWRSIENEREKQEIIAALEKAGIPTETLAHQKEAEYAALHTLDIVAPYYRDAKHIFTEELGGGSFQATLFKQPFRHRNVVSTSDERLAGDDKVGRPREN